MAITQRGLGAGIGGASLGLIGAEITRHAVERDFISPRLGWGIIGVGAAGSLGLIGADLAGITSLPAGILPLAGGVGTGSTAWYAARSAGVAPRLVIDIPDRINLADPLTTTLLLGLVSVAVGTTTSILL